MLKFFRKIRQELISENRVSKYLLYAIGEILLVVIGILIALQINNWNESNRNFRAETAALIELKREYQNNAKRFAEHLTRKEGQLLEWKGFLLTVSNKNLPVSQRGIDRPAPGTRIFTPSQNTLDKLLYTGEIDKLQNDSLRNLLASWNTVLGLFQVREEDHRNFWHDQFRPLERTLVPQYAGPEVPVYSYTAYSSPDDLMSPFFSEKERTLLRLKAYDEFTYQNLLMRNHFLLFSTIRDGKALQNTLDQIIDLLNEEIMKRKLVILD